MVAKLLALGESGERSFSNLGDVGEGGVNSVHQRCVANWGEHCCFQLNGSEMHGSSKLEQFFVVIEAAEAKVA